MKAIITIIIVVLLVAAGLGNVYAADQPNHLSTRWTYAQEWVNTHLLTWRNRSKIIVLDRYATRRTNDIKLAYQLDQTDRVQDFNQRYLNLKQKISAILEQKQLPNQADLIEIVKTNALEQQKILSEARQNASDADKPAIALIQEETANQIKNIISTIKDEKTANDFTNQIVTVWRDPVGTVKDEPATRVYAVGTQATSNNANDGVIIDNGQGKISQDNKGDIKIEYAPGTGPSSVTTAEGKKIWKIQLSDGSVVESYTAAGQVVVGGSTGTASNIIVNTVVGGGAGAADVKVEGGVPTGKTDKTDTGANSSAGQNQVIVEPAPAQP